MSLSSDELSRMAEAADADRTILHSVYCGHCGYNLRHGPYVGRCPECGNPYNARPLNMKGIFVPQEVRFPLSGLSLTLFGLVCGGWVIRSGIRLINDWLLILGAALTFLGLYFARATYRDLKRFFHFLRVRRLIENDEDD